MLERMKYVYDFDSKPAAVRRVSCSDFMTAMKALRNSLGVIFFILETNLPSCDSNTHLDHALNTAPPKYASLAQRADLVSANRIQLIDSRGKVRAEFALSADN